MVPCALPVSSHCTVQRTTQTASLRGLPFGAGAASALDFLPVGMQEEGNPTPTQPDALTLTVRNIRGACVGLWDLKWNCSA
jgi:hypothetical protein